MFRPWALLLLFTSALPRSLERRQTASGASDTPTDAGTSAIVTTSQTVASSVTTTLSESISSVTPTDITVTTPTPIQSSDTRSSVTSPSTTSPLASSFSSTSTSVYSRQTDQDTTVTVVVTSTQHTGQVATTTVFSTSISTIVVSSTNFITSTVTSNNLDTATITRYVTFTTYAKRSINIAPFTTAADINLRWRGLASENAAAARLTKRSTFFVTVTDAVTQLSGSTITLTQMVVQQTSVLTTINVVVTSVVYPGARTTVTVESTLTVTSTSVSVGTTTITSTARPTSSTATTPTNTSLSTPAVTAPADGGLSVAAKAGIGGGAGGFVLLVAVIFAIVMLRKRRRNRFHPWTAQSSEMVEHRPPGNRVNRFSDLGSMTAHHGLAELDLRQPTIPDEAAVLGTVARKPVVYNSVGEIRNSPPPKYEGGKSAIAGAVELPMRDAEAMYEYGQHQSHTRALSEPEPVRSELGGGTSPASGGVSRWSAPARGRAHHHMVSDASELDTAGPPAQGWEISQAPPHSRQAAELNGSEQPGQASRYLHQPLQAFYEMTGDQPAK